MLFTLSKRAVKPAFLNRPAFIETPERFRPTHAGLDERFSKKNRQYTMYNLTLLFHHYIWRFLCSELMR